MVSAHPLRARQAIHDFRSDFLDNLPFAHPALDRLEADQDGNVTAGLQRLEAEYDPPVIHYLRQAVDLAASQHSVISETIKRADEYKRKARQLREIADLAPFPLRTDMQKFADSLEARARFLESRPAALGINRKCRDEAAVQRLAIQHFVRCLEDRLNIACSHGR